MKCPKCGFDQPDDRFCANCGVDVALYTPEKKILKSFFRSAVFYVLLALIIIVSGVWFLSRLHSNRTDVVSIDRPNSVFKKPGPEPSNSQLQVSAADNTTDTAAKESPSTTNPPTKSQPVSEPTKTLKPKATTFRVSLLEVDLEYAPIMLGTALDGRLHIGVARENLNGKNFSERLSLGIERGAVTQYGSAVQTISTDEQNLNTFSFVSFDQRINGDVGLVLHLKASQLDEKGSTVLIAGRRIIGREESPQPDVLNFEQEVIIPLERSVYIVGLLKGRNPLDTNEATMFSSNPAFAIFRSVKFRTNQSTFVLLVDAVERP